MQFSKTSWPSTASLAYHHNYLLANTLISFDLASFLYTHLSKPQPLLNSTTGSIPAQDSWWLLKENNRSFPSPFTPILHLTQLKALPHPSLTYLKLLHFSISKSSHLGQLFILSSFLIIMDEGYLLPLKPTPQFVIWVRSPLLHELSL